MAAIKKTLPKTIFLKNWEYKQENVTTWKPCLNSENSISEIHLELRSNNEIDEPFLNDNEKYLQWIGLKNWEYRSHFKISYNDNDNGNDKFKLIFYGLDTFAKIYLNGSLILTTDNMFVKYCVDVDPMILNVDNQNDGINELKILFESSLLKSRNLFLNGDFKPKGFNGELSRCLIRKAQYHYGWDWGPIFMTCGPYRPIEFLHYNHCCILNKDEIYIHPKFNDNSLNNIELIVENIHVEVSEKGYAIVVELYLPTGELSQSQEILIDNSSVNICTSFKLKKAYLWYPSGHGLQQLYSLNINLIHKGNIASELEPEIMDSIKDKKFGIKKVELIQDNFLNSNIPGKTFYFKINNKPIFCKGSNWIPAHSFQTSLTKDDYIRWLELGVHANQNILRVWGGGYYENEWFYEECDRLGIMVWQDFMFACGQYPGNSKFRESVKQEVSYQVKRLRNYCCLILYCGNNEDYQVIEQLKLTDKEFEAKIIYEKDIAQIVAELHPLIPYHPGSPYSDPKLLSDDPNVGDIHQWNIWHGTQERYQDSWKLAGRFISEFGMIAFPNYKTLKQSIDHEKQLFPQSELVNFHMKADGSEARIGLYLMSNFKIIKTDLKSWIYYTQLLQSECLTYCFRNWRRNWSTDGNRLTSGIIVWQLNDCWPVTSWAIVDFYKRPKLAYYAVKREFASIVLGFNRSKIDPQTGNHIEKDEKQDNTHQYFLFKEKLEIFGMSSLFNDLEVYLNLKYFNAETGVEIEKLAVKSYKTKLKANGTSELTELTVVLPYIHNETDQDENLKKIVVFGTLSDLQGNILSRSSDWPQPLKYISLNYTDKDLKFEAKNGCVLVLAKKPIKCVQFYMKDDSRVDQVFFHDNGFDLCPTSEFYTVPADGLLETDDIGVEYYDKV
ncbi:hypothetical protein PACTADRAFT_31195 [Pachysolen tannophilus NRRL Y-2460]|uniref:beta-mannosidase n=1 Tax=Pachysolen tannophilus NRRL Y-2460 TaxID=669874 RepID=A0A1E4U1A0_PACTA|nr:hypothetical protein PACTADRAFT_31195 [Pachysolen tannophilus NRRL Y-2460]